MWVAVPTPAFAVATDRFHKATLVTGRWLCNESLLATRHHDVTCCVKTARDQATLGQSVFAGDCGRGRKRRIPGPDCIFRVERVAMPTGTVKWFNPTKGYGFIQPSDGGNDAFVHISAVERAGLHTLREGQKVEYELVPGRNGKSSAENLVALD